MMTIYVDMDGVIADFDRFVKEKTGKFFDEHGTSQAGWDSVKEWPNLYAWLEPMPDAYDLMEGIWDIVTRLHIVDSTRVEVLTAIPKIGRIPTAKQDKLEWVQKKHFDRYYDAFNIGPLAEHKQYHCKPGDVLIDDKARNIEQWASKGGIGILHTSAESTLKALKAALCQANQ